MTVNHPHQHDDTHIGVEPTVNDHGAQRRVWLALGGRDFGDHGLEDLLHAHAGFGRARNGLARIDADHVFDFSLGVVWIGGRQIHFVEDRHHLDAEVECGVTVRHGLRFNALAGIDHQQGTLASGQRATHLVREVDMPGCVDQIQVVNLAVFGLVSQRSGLRLDGYPTLFFDVHRVQHLRFHLSVAQAAAALNDAVSQGGFAVVNVRDDRKISDVVHQCKQLSV